MPVVRKAIDEYLDALERVQGREYREKTSIQHGGGAEIVLEFPDGARLGVDIGRLNLMTELLQQQATDSLEAA